jgi:hypothetical protein
MKCFLLSMAALFFLTIAAWGQVAIDRSDILKDPEWQSVYDAYTPDAGLIAILREQDRDLRIDVYLGLWCSDSRNHVPVFLKILDSAGLSRLKVNFFTVERKKEAGRQFFVPERKVERVPTFLFLVGEDEIGRIVENPLKTILEDMLEILR